MERWLIYNLTCKVGESHPLNHEKLNYYPYIYSNVHIVFYDLYQYNFICTINLEKLEHTMYCTLNSSPIYNVILLISKVSLDNNILKKRK